METEDLMKMRNLKHIDPVKKTRMHLLTTLTLLSTAVDILRCPLNL